MNNFEELENIAAQKNVEIIPYHFESERIKGLYCDNTIALSTSLQSTAERTCILAEEIGHHETSRGNILDQQNITNIKQERKARLWAYDKLISLFGIVRAYNAGCRTSYEMADYLNITEEFLIEALCTYKEKYGTNIINVGDYFIVFEPEMIVFKISHN